MMGQPSYRLNYDCTLFKYNEQILLNCKPFNCGVEDLNDFFANDALAYEKDLMGFTTQDKKPDVDFYWLMLSTTLIPSDITNEMDFCHCSLVLRMKKNTIPST